MTDTPDERLMTRFLLDDLHGDERAAVHDRAASDADFFEALCAHEDELLLLYHRGELTAGEQKLLERAYSSPARKQRVASALAFLEAARRAKAGRPARPFAWQRAREWLTTPRVVPTFALAGALLLLACAVPLALYPSLFGPLIVQELGKPRPGDSTARVVVAFQLAGVDERRAASATGGTSQLRVPADATEVRLDVQFAEPIGAAQGLEVELTRLEGGAIVTGGRWRLTGAGAALVLSVPAGELVAGDYTLTVRRRAAAGPDLAAHAFRVSRE